jgi:hypothetical protein
VRLQQTINEQNLSKPERLGNSAPLCSGQRVCYGEEYEPMPDASVEYRSQPNRNWVGWVSPSAASGGELVLANDPETGVAVAATALGIDLRAPGARVRTGYSRLLKQTMEWAWNLGTLAWLPPILGMIKTADDRRAKGRSLRSSLSAGKPHTWRREAVDTVLRQEVGACPAW